MLLCHCCVRVVRALCFCRVIVVLVVVMGVYCYVFGVCAFVVFVVFLCVVVAFLLCSCFFVAFSH